MSIVEWLLVLVIMPYIVVIVITNNISRIYIMQILQSSNKKKHK